MARQKMGNKSLSPSLVAFGFTSKKRSNGTATAEAAGSPPKRVKTEPTGHVASQAQENDLVDLTQGSNDSSDERRRERSDLMNVTSDNAELSQSTGSADAAISARPALSPTRNERSSPIQHSNLPNSLGLVRVKDPNNILCTTAVANARSDSNGIKKVFPGAALGRTSNSSGKDASFVELGISSDAKGISRKHVMILSIHGLNDDRPETMGDETSVLTAYSSNSAKSSTSTVVSTATAATLSNPTMLIKVIRHPNPNRVTLKIKIHRTRRGKRRALDLRQDESKTLKVGDAIEFISDGEKYYFCVVAFYDEKADLVDQNAAVDENPVDANCMNDVKSHEVEQNVHDAIEIEPINQFANDQTKDVMTTTEVSSVPENLTGVKPSMQDAAGSKTEFTEETAPVTAPTASSPIKLVVNPVQTLKNRDSVRVVYQLADAFGIEHEEW
jgi:hypothetical protein